MPPDAAAELADAVTALRLATAGAIAAGPVVFERLDFRPLRISPILPIAATQPRGEAIRLDQLRARLAADLRERLTLADSDRAPRRGARPLGALALRRGAVSLGSGPREPRLPARRATAARGRRRCERPSCLQTRHASGASSSSRSTRSGCGGTHVTRFAGRSSRRCSTGIARSSWWRSTRRCSACGRARRRRCASRESGAEAARRRHSFPATVEAWTPPPVCSPGSIASSGSTRRKRRRPSSSRSSASSPSRPRCGRARRVIGARWERRSKLRRRAEGMSLGGPNG